MTSIYIESADEITTVIERLRDAQEETVALVAPKGATLLQSVVNLKLARKAAKDAGKQIIIVSTDTIGKNLCSQLGIPVAATEEEGLKILMGAAEAAGGDDAKVIAGVRIHRYYDEDDAKEEEGKPEPIIIPKQMLKEEVVAASEPIAVPAGIPEPPLPTEVVQPPATEAEPLTRSKIARDENAAEPAAQEVTKKEKVKREPQPTTPLQKRIIKLSLLIGGAGVLAIITMMFLFLPLTTVKVAVRATDWNKELAFAATTELQETSFDKTTLPAEKLNATSDKSITFKATGTKQVGEKATGNITFYNYDTTTPITVPAGLVVTAGGKSFTTTTTVQVPGYTKASGQPPVPGSKASPIVAVDAGPESNMTDASASDVRVPGGNLTFNTITASGGTNKTVTVISAEDFSKAKEELTKQLTEDVKAKLGEQLTNRAVTYKEENDKLSFTTVTSTSAVGAEVAEAQVAGSATLNRTVINTPTIQSAIDDRLRGEQLTTKNYEVTSSNIAITGMNEDGTSLNLVVTLAGKEAPIIPIETFPAKLSGKSLNVGQQIVIDDVPASTVTVSQAPGWWPVKRFPTVSRYIVIDVTYE